MEKLFTELDDDIIKDYMIDFMTVDDIISYCSTNTEYSEICNDNELWKKLVVRDFGILPSSITGNIIINILNNGERNYYELYKILLEIYKLDEQAIIKLVKVYLDTNKDIKIIYNILDKLLLGKNIQELRKIYQLMLKIWNDLNRRRNIFPEVITKNPEYLSADIMKLSINIQNRIDKRILLIILSLIKDNGIKLLKLLDKALIKNNNYVMKLKEYKKLDDRTIILLNSKTKESYWYILSVLAYFYGYLFDSSFLIIFINKNIDNETKNYLLNYNLNLNINIKDIIRSFYSNNDIFDNFIPTNPEFISLVNRTLTFVKGYYIFDQDIVSLKDPSQENIESIIDIFLKQYNLYQNRNITLDIVDNIRIPPKYRHTRGNFRAVIN